MFCKMQDGTQGERLSVPCYAERKSNSRQKADHFLFVLWLHPPGPESQERGQRKPLDASEPALFILTISPPSIHSPRGSEKNKQTDLPYFHSCPLRRRSRCCLLTAMKSTSFFYLKWFPAALPTNHLFSKCVTFSQLSFLIINHRLSHHLPR